MSTILNYLLKPIRDEAERQDALRWERARQEIIQRHLPPKPACGNCLFFRSGKCRRMPPKALGPFTVGDGFPEVDEKNWCGEWRLATGGGPR